MGILFPKLARWALWCVGSAGVAGAQIPLEHHPPQLALHRPPVYPAAFAEAAARKAYSAGVWCDAEGQIVSLDTTGTPPEIAAALEASLRASIFRPAREGAVETRGYRRVLFRAYFTPVPGAPTPQPRFQLDPAARDKLDSVGRAVVRGWLRIRLTVDEKGNIRRVDTQNRGLNEALMTFFRNDIDRSRPVFEPAQLGEHAVSGVIDLFWDLTPPQDRQDFTEVETELVRLGENPLEPGPGWPHEATRFRAWVLPHASNRVVGAHGDAGTPAVLLDAFLERAAQWFIPDRNIGSPLEVALRYEPEPAALFVESFRPVPVVGPSLRFSSRPIYPRRRLLPNPTGFVRVQFTVDTEGRPTDMMILEASSDRFREPAMEALQTWHFSPMTIDGEAVPARLFWTLPFDPKVRP